MCLQCAEYCNRVCDEKGRTCKEMGASLTWLKGHGADHNDLPRRILLLHR